MSDEEDEGFFLDKPAEPEEGGGENNQNIVTPPPSPHDLVSTRLVKRKRTPLRSSDPIIIPKFRLKTEKEEEEEEERQGEVSDIKPIKKRSAVREPKEKPDVLNESIHEEEDEDEEESHSGMELFSDFSDEEEAASPVRKKRARESMSDHEKDDDEEGNNEPDAKRIKREEDAPKNSRDGRRGKNATSRYTLMSENWDSYASFPKNMVPNLMRMARITDRAIDRVEEQRDGDDDDDDVVEIEEDIRFTKEAIPVFENFLHTRFGQMIQQTRQMHRHRNKERMNAADVKLAIKSNPAFLPFDVEAYLNGHRNEAPALITFMDQLRVGKANSKTPRCVYQHTDLEATRR